MMSNHSYDIIEFNKSCLFFLGLFHVRRKDGEIFQLKQRVVENNGRLTLGVACLLMLTRLPSEISR
jgi:hypothetical protein